MLPLTYVVKAFSIGLFFSLFLMKPLISWLKKQGFQDHIHKDH